MNNSDLIERLESRFSNEMIVGGVETVPVPSHTLRNAITALRSQQEQIEALETHLRWVPTLPEDVESKVANLIQLRGEEYRHGTWERDVMTDGIDSLTQLSRENARLLKVVERLGDDRDMAEYGDMPIPSSVELEARIEYARANLETVSEDTDNE